MTLLAYALTTVQRAADYLGLGTVASGSALETKLQAEINAVTAFIENYIGFRVKQTTYTNEVYDTEKGDTIILQRKPVSGVVLQMRASSLNEDSWETIDSQYYRVDEAAGIIYGMAGWRFARARGGYRVSYTAGYNFDNSTTFLGETAGADLELAAFMLIGAVHSRAASGAGIKSERIGDYSVVYQGALMENDDVLSILDKYADIATGTYLTPYHY